MRRILYFSEYMLLTDNLRVLGYLNGMNILVIDKFQENRKNINLKYAKNMKELMRSRTTVIKSRLIAFNANPHIIEKYYEIKKEDKNEL